MKKRTRVLKPGDRVLILQPHPWGGCVGELIAYEKYGLGWMGWRVQLEGFRGQCYANTEQLRLAE